MQSAHAVFECHACQTRRDVTIADDSAARAMPDDDQARAKRVRELLRHATCPACKARDPDAAAAHRRAVWRGRLGLAAFDAGVAAIAYFLPTVALIPPIMIMLIWVLALRIRLRRRYWFPIVSELLLAAAMTTWVLVERDRAYLVPAAVALLVLVPRASSSDPFADAAEQLRFAESPYRG